MGFKDFYLVINFMCIFLLLWTIFKTVQSGDKQVHNVMFSHLLMCTQFVLICEILWVFVEGESFFLAYYLNCLSNILIQCLSAIIGYYWLLYTLCEGETKKWITKQKSFLIFLPALIVCLMALCSPITGWLFAIEKRTNAFSYGNLNIIKVLIVYSYFFIASLIIFANIINRNIIKEKAEIVGKLSCILIPLIAMLHYLYNPQVPVVWQSITIILLISHSNILDKTIYTDGLTGLNNRKEFNKYLDSVLKNLPSQPNHAYLFMIDIDLFKKINDTFGHIEGDNAIVTTAQTLKDTVKEEKVFVCRYGGDEFALIFPNLNRYKAQAIQDELYKAFTLYNELSLTKYSINISVGFAAALPGVTDTPSNLIKAADKMLYEEKQAHHARYSV